MALAEVPDIDARQHDLASTFASDTLGFGDDLGDRAATASPSGLGDGAVGAVVVTAVLYLQEVARALVGGRADAEGAYVLRAPSHDTGTRITGALQIEVVGDVELLLRSDDQMDTLDVCDLLGAELGIAARHDDEGARMLTGSLADHRAALLVRQLRHRAGVDDADVGYLPRTHAPHPLGKQRAPDGRCLGEVELTAEGVVGGFLVFEDRGVGHRLGRKRRRR